MSNFFTVGLQEAEKSTKKQSGNSFAGHPVDVLLACITWPGEDSLHIPWTVSAGLHQVSVLDYLTILPDCLSPMIWQT
jgi:hypothetical protein